MNQDSFSKSEFTREQAADIAADPLALIQILGGNQAKKARNQAEVEAAEDQGRLFGNATELPTLGVPADLEAFDGYTLIHNTVEAASEFEAPKKKAHVGTPHGVVLNTVIQNNWEPPRGNGCLSNVYSGILLQSKSTGQWFTTMIAAGVTFIPADLDIDAALNRNPLKEAVERGVIQVLPPGVRFERKMLSKVAREKAVLFAINFCAEDANSLRFYADLVQGDMRSALLRKAAALTEEDQTSAWKKDLHSAG